MNLRVTEPGHVLLRHRPPLRWVLLGLAVLLSSWAIHTALLIGFAGGPRLAVALGVLLALGALVALRQRVEIAIGPERVVWRKRPGWGLRWRERSHPRAELLAVELDADVVAGALQKEAIRRLQLDVGLRFAPGTVPERWRLRSFQSERRARAWVRRLCEAAEIAFLDCTGERPELRLPGQLGGPPTERPPAPATPAPRGVDVQPDPLLGEIMTLRSWTGRRAVLTLSDGELRVAGSWFALPLRSRRIPIRSIERVRSQRGQAESIRGRTGASATDVARRSRHLAPGIVIATATGGVRVAGWLSPVARQWATAWLMARLWPDLPTTRAPQSAPTKRRVDATQSTRSQAVLPR